MRRLLLLIVAVLQRTPVIEWLRTARGWRDQYLDPQVRQLRSVVRQMERGQVDILFLGDSSATFFGPGDVDRRRLPEMLGAELGQRVAVIAGPGYNPPLYSELVRILGTLPQRPRAVVLSRAVRTSCATHVRQHPEYGYRRSIATLRRASGAHGLRAFSRSNRRTPQEYAAFEALPVRTRWERASTIGGFLALVRGRRTAGGDLATQQALFDYFHGELLDPGIATVGELTELAARLRAYGVPVVHYYPPIPVERGEQYFPGEFEAQVRASYAVVDGVLEAGLGDLGALVETPFDTPDDEFIDPTDGSEHWNEKGRARIARRIAELVQQARVDA
ncbi:hypothetical protein [Nocardioides jiangxiensis]|uniref:SGNH hydrolase-type esterase domain-containing protein n=1 Tax=Nocardioides jiangxiensis TaxID=3064524 RepID=A0ABT9AZ36_9ACTN|nr:hypothetical protein [Nocardioides sp. WY-20]MDO7867851.1 hypothetical protein [Nocardioides sp. WY-20]